MNSDPPDSHGNGDPSPGGTSIDDIAGRIAAGDAQASATFMAMVHDRACGLVQEALIGAEGQRSPAVERLVRAYRRDELQIQAALLSAQTTFRRHLLKNSDSAEIRDERDCVTALISLAYNRWQRQRYEDRKAQGQAALGSSGDRDVLLAEVADPDPGPDHLPMIADFYEKLVEEVHLLCSELKPGEPEAVFLRLFEELTYDQISRRVGRPVSSVHRICQQVKAHLLRRFRDSAP